MDGEGRHVTSRQERLVLAAILLFAAVIRIAFNDIAAYSRADERVYTSYARDLAEIGVSRGYPQIIRAYLDHPRLWFYPPPSRWSHLLLATLAVEIYGAPEPRALAWLSTVAGILVVPLVFVLGRRLFGSRAGLVAAAFTAVSPIELALGRRALQDEVVAFVVTLALALLIEALSRTDRLSAALAIFGMTWAFGMKESFVLLYPAFIAVLFVLRRPRSLGVREAAIFVAPPALHVLAFAALSRSATDLFTIVRHAMTSIDSPYVAQYQSGPPHRVLFDFFLASPLVSILAAAAVVMVLLGMMKSSGERAMAAYLIAGVAAFALLESKNLRICAVLDPAMRLMSAAAVAGSVRVLRTSALVAIAASNASVDLELFHALFVEGGIYDPVTIDLVRTLGAAPRPTPQADHRMMFPLVTAAIAAGAWAWAWLEREPTPRSSAAPTRSRRSLPLRAREAGR